MICLFIAAVKEGLASHSYAPSNLAGEWTAGRLHLKVSMSALLSNSVHIAGVLTRFALLSPRQLQQNRCSRQCRASTSSAPCHRILPRRTSTASASLHHNHFRIVRIGSSCKDYEQNPVVISYANHNVRQPCCRGNICLPVLPTIFCARGFNEQPANASNVIESLPARVATTRACMSATYVLHFRCTIGSQVVVL